MSEHLLCTIHDVDEEESKEFVIEGAEGDRSVFVVKKDGLISIFENHCPHLGVPLNMAPDRFLDVEKNFVLCSTHGALFKIEDGECVHGPCFGQNLTPVNYVLRGEEVFVTKDL